MRRLVMVLAWLFTLGTILSLALILALRSPSIDHGNAAIFGWSDGTAPSTGGYGLTYVDRRGYSLAALELILIIVAAWLSCRRTGAWRRVGLVLLVVWSALWLLGSVRQLAGTRELECWFYATIMAVLLLAAALRARWRWAS
jgi:hypothetical protein